MKRAFLVVAFLVLSGVSAMADDDDELVPLSKAKGRIVRVWTPDRVQGTLTAFDGETIAVRVSTGEVRSFDRAAVRKMEVRGRGPMFYVAIGAPAAAAGALLGYGFMNLCVLDPCPAVTGAENAAAMLGGAAVGVLATVLPVRLHKGWGDGVEVRRKTTAVVVPVRHGVAAMVRISF
jgi:ribosomal protein L28